MSKKLKSIIALFLVMVVFATSCLMCFAANGPGYKVKYYTGLVVGVNCKILKDQDRAPYYKYNRCKVRLREGTYDSGWKYSSTFSNQKSSVQFIEKEIQRTNNIKYTSYANYGLIK